MSNGRIQTVMAIGLAAVSLAYAVLVARDFYWFADRLIYAAVDDGLANQAVMIATEGRYGFISSPTLLGVPRHFGEISYGPWYFYFAAGLVWLFGYSLTLVRSVHLLTITATAVAASLWFPGRSRPIAAAMFALAVFHAFAAGMWPMARPDSAVTVFAVGLAITAGLAMRDGRPRYWFLAGLSASSGAFAHLIAWTLVPVCLALFATWAWLLAPGQGHQPPSRIVRASLIAMAAGGLLGALTFYASFGFRIGDQFRMFDAYSTLIHSSEGYWPTLQRHLDYAFSYLSGPMQAALAAAVLAGAGMGVALLRAPDTRPIVLTWLLPPMLIWTAYLVSNGWYTNQHKGYAIVHQVMAAWSIAAVAAVGLRALELRRAAWWRRIAPAMALAIAVVGVSLIAGALEARPLKQQQAARWVSIAEHTDRLLGNVPAGATAWGSVMFGIEAPRRLQLVQIADAVRLVERLEPAERAAYAPEFLIWGYPEVRDLTVAVVADHRPSIAHRMETVLHGSAYRLVAIVAAEPYGVNRVYARSDAAVDPAQLPSVEVYDAGSHRWLNGIGDAVVDALVPSPPVPLRIGYDAAAPSKTPVSTMVADLPRGDYLLRVFLRSGRDSERLLAAVSATGLDQTIGELGPRGDFAAYGATDSSAILLARHDGGRLYVSQFDGAGARIDRVDVHPIHGMQGPVERSWRAVATTTVASWTPSPGVQATTTSEGVLAVQGDASMNGYQIVSAPVMLAAPQTVTVSLDLSVEHGRVCTGILDDQQQKWIIPADQLRDRLSFAAERSGPFWVVVANCGGAEPREASQFTVRAARVITEPMTFYTDRLMDAAMPGR